MSKLQRKIKALEASMNHDAYCMHQSWLVVARFTHSLRFILTAGALTFMAGVVLGYKRNFLKVTKSLVFLSNKIYKLRSRAALFLSIMP